MATPKTVPVNSPVDAKKTGLLEASANTGTTVSVNVTVPDAFWKRPVPPVIARIAPDFSVSLELRSTQRTMPNPHEYCPSLMRELAWCHSVLFRTPNSGPGVGGSNPLSPTIYSHTKLVSCLWRQFGLQHSLTRMDDDAKSHLTNIYSVVLS